MLFHNGHEMINGPVPGLIQMDNAPSVITRMTFMKMIQLNQLPRG
jgi:hypothetical protein